MLFLRFSEFCHSKIGYRSKKMDKFTLGVLKNNIFWKKVVKNIKLNIFYIWKQEDFKRLRMENKAINKTLIEP